MSDTRIFLTEDESGLYYNLYAPDANVMTDPPLVSFSTRLGEIVIEEVVIKKAQEARMLARVVLRAAEMLWPGSLDDDERDLVIQEESPDKTITKETES